jgi:hypothetical protein
MTREETLKAANECVNGMREQDYGTPEDNFDRIAKLWNAYLYSDKEIPAHTITAKDVSMMMSLMKIARVRSGGNVDCFVDLAGYAACGCEIFTKDS